NGVEVDLAGLLRAGAEFNAQEARRARHIGRGQQDTNNAHALPEGFRLSVPDAFDQYGLADITQGGSSIELNTWLTHGGALLAWLGPGSVAAVAGGPAS